jgi:hypothetical protein
MQRTLLDTRRASREARQVDRVAKAAQHGWTLTCLPLRVSLLDRMRDRAIRFAGSEIGDSAEDLLDRVGA